MKESEKSISPVEKAYRWILKYGIWLFAAGVVLLNVSLIFDNVVWGDEAFSGGVIRDTNLYGIYQRIYFWDCHPPLYYYYLRLFADVLGYHTWVYHVASILPFVGGILLALTVIRKHMGSIPAAFLILISGLSETCVIYNQEIRMYALCFFEILFCAYFSYRILVFGDKKSDWVGYVIAGLFAAYTHYYGLVTGGMLLFVTSVLYFFKKKGKSWSYGVISIGAYLLLYLPWLSVLYRQASVVSRESWRERPEELNVVLNFLFGGAAMRRILLPAVILLSVIFIASETGAVRIRQAAKGEFVVKFSLPSIKCFESGDFRAFTAYWISVLAIVFFSYAASYLFHPILYSRYLYPMMPLLLVILVICVKGFLLGAFGKEEILQEEASEERMFRSANGKARLAAVVLLWVVLLVIGLFDFKHNRSVMKTEDFQTKRVLDLIGEPAEGTVFTSLGVSHLSWTVLDYYYPGFEVDPLDPIDLETDAHDIWAFMGYKLDEGKMKEMQRRGYLAEEYPDMWMGKYGCTIYHFHK